MAKVLPVLYDLDNDDDEERRKATSPDLKVDGHFDFPEITSLPNDFDDLTLDQIISFAFVTEGPNAAMQLSLFRSFGVYMDRKVYDPHHLIFMLDVYKVLRPGLECDDDLHVGLNHFIVQRFIRGREFAQVPVNLPAHMYVNLETTVNDVDKFRMNIYAAETEVRHLLEPHHRAWAAWLKEQVADQKKKNKTHGRKSGSSTARFSRAPTTRCCVQ